MATIAPVGSGRNERICPTLHAPETRYPGLPGQTPVPVSQQNQRHARELALASALWAACGLDAAEGKVLSAVVELAHGQPTVDLTREAIAAHLRVSLRTVKSHLHTGLARLRVAGLGLVVERSRGVFDLAGYDRLRVELARVTDGADVAELTPAAVELVGRQLGRTPRPASERERRAAVTLLSGDVDAYVTRQLRRLEHERRDLGREDKLRTALRCIRALETRIIEELRRNGDPDDGHDESANFALSTPPAAERESANFADLTPAEPDDGATNFRPGYANDCDSGVNPVPREPDHSAETRADESVCSKTYDVRSLSSSSERPKEPTNVRTHERTDDDVVGRATSAKNGRKFSKLMAGDATDYGDATKALFGLLRMLDYWTDHGGEQAVRVARRSKLTRDYGDAWLRTQLAALGCTFTTTAMVTPTPGTNLLTTADSAPTRATGDGLEDAPNTIDAVLRRLRARLASNLRDRFAANAAVAELTDAHGIARDEARALVATELDAIETQLAVGALTSTPDGWRLGDGAIHSANLTGEHSATAVVLNPTGGATMPSDCQQCAGLVTDAARAWREFVPPERKRSH